MVLHLAVNDAIGKVVGANLDTQESLKNYYNVFYLILNMVFLPALIPSDVLFLNIKKELLFR